MGLHALSGLGGRIAVRRAVEQPDAEACLQRGEPAADRGLGDMEVFGGGHEAAAPGQGKEEAQVVPVEHRPFPRLRIPARHF